MESQTEMRYRFVRGHGSDIFWGCLSLFFAVVACYFFFSNNDNELRARELRDQNTILSEEKKNLQAKVDELQTATSNLELLQQARDKALIQQKADLEALKNKASNLSQAQAILNERSDLQREIATRMRRSITDFSDVDFIDVVNRDGEWALRIENSALFVPGKFELTPEAEKILTSLAKQVKPFMETHELRLEAFTDSDPITGTNKKRFSSNTELSAARAEVVASYLEKQAGIDPNRLAVVARGERMPVVPNDSSDNKAKNRRLEIILDSRQPISPPTVSEKDEKKNAG